VERAKVDAVVAGVWVSAELAEGVTLAMVEVGRLRGAKGLMVGSRLALASRRREDLLHHRISTLPVDSLRDEDSRRAKSGQPAAIAGPGVRVSLGCRSSSSMDDAAGWRPPAGTGNGRTWQEEVHRS
jgi:hypothetical protein